MAGTKAKRWYQGLPPSPSVKHRVRHVGGLRLSNACWTDRHPPALLSMQIPGPGSYTRGVNDTTFANASASGRRSKTGGGTLSRSRRDWHVVRNVSPGPGEYERNDEGTFAKTFACVWEAGVLGGVQCSQRLLRGTHAVRSL